MRKALLATITLLAGFAANAGMTAGDLLRSCHEYQKYKENSAGNSPVSAFAIECKSYIQGALDKILHFYSDYEAYDSYICLPENISEDEMISVIYTDLSSVSDEKLKFLASGNVAASLARAYPCEVNKTAEVNQ